MWFAKRVQDNMTQWQFLIQKEGDQDWLPLESPSTEILEGRYQLMVQSHQPGLDISVQIRHEYEVGGVQQEVVQRRQQQADALGYLDLLSSTYLPPGLWELKCRSTDRDASPPEKILLQVLAQDFDLATDWDDLDLPDTSATSVELSEELNELPSPAVAPNPSPALASKPAPKPRPVVNPSGQGRSVSLPVISEEAAPLVFEAVQGLQLPPMIYKPHATEPVSPQLPDFLPIADLSTDPEAVSAEEYLVFLRGIAKAADRSGVKRAFESLEWRQRFLSKLKTLAQPYL